MFLKCTQVFFRSTQVSLRCSSGVPRCSAGVRRCPSGVLQVYTGIPQVYTGVPQGYPRVTLVFLWCSSGIPGVPQVYPVFPRCRQVFLRCRLGEQGVSRGYLPPPANPWLPNGFYLRQDQNHSNVRTPVMFAPLLLNKEDMGREKNPKQSMGPFFSSWPREKTGCRSARRVEEWGRKWNGERPGNEQQGLLQSAPAGVRKKKVFL